MKNLISKVYSAHVFSIGTLCWRAWYWFTWASLRALQNRSWSSYAFWRMNGGDQIHWTFIVPSHGNKTSMASPDVISTIHPLFHRRGDDNVLGKPFSICPYRFALIDLPLWFHKQVLFWIQAPKKDEGHSKNCPYISYDTCPQLEQ